MRSIDRFEDWASRRRMDLEMLLLQATPRRGTYPQLEAAIQRSLVDSSRTAGLLTLATSEVLGGDAELALRGAAAIELWRASTRAENFAHLAVRPARGTRESTGCRADDQVAHLAARSHLANAVSILSAPGIDQAAAQLRLVNAFSAVVGQASELSIHRRLGSSSLRMSDRRDAELAILGLQFVAATDFGIGSAGAARIDEAMSTTISGFARNLAAASHVCTEVRDARKDEAVVRGPGSELLAYQAGIAPYDELPGLCSAQAYLRRLRVRIDTQLAAARFQDSPLEWLAKTQFAMLGASDPSPGEAGNHSNLPPEARRRVNFCSPSDEASTGHPVEHLA